MAIPMKYVVHSYSHVRRSLIGIGYSFMLEKHFVNQKNQCIPVLN